MPIGTMSEAVIYLRRDICPLGKMICPFREIATALRLTQRLAMTYVLSFRAKRGNLVGTKPYERDEAMCVLFFAMLSKGHSCVCVTESYKKNGF